jgi:hypothetical protein
MGSWPPFAAVSTKGGFPDDAALGAKHKGDRWAIALGKPI